MTWYLFPCLCICVCVRVRACTCVGACVHIYVYLPKTTRYIYIFKAKSQKDFVNRGSTWPRASPKTNILPEKIKLWYWIFDLSMKKILYIHHDILADHIADFIESFCLYRESGVLYVFELRLKDYSEPFVQCWYHSKHSNQARMEQNWTGCANSTCGGCRHYM